ncbi:MAG: hypothetical protein Q8R48_02820 [Candidatus Omnitrophota bacterium]|nr:hypothetical protein [Candidatus Omnitrophota bacterium]
MKKLSFLLVMYLFLLFALSGCATTQEDTGGGYESPSGHSGHSH